MTQPLFALACGVYLAWHGWHLLCVARDHRAATGERLPWTAASGMLLWLAGGCGVFWASYDLCREM